MQKKDLIPDGTLVLHTKTNAEGKVLSYDGSSRVYFVQWENGKKSHAAPRYVVPKPHPAMQSR
jgi:hypothetical protein